MPGPGVMAVNDPQGWLSFTGGLRVLAREPLADGVERRWYGVATEEEAAASRYVKASCELGLTRLITDGSRVDLRDFALDPADSKMSFRVEVDSAAVASGAIRGMVEVRDGLTDGAWHEPGEGAVDFREGTVRVTPEEGDAGFIRVRIPMD